jgi:ABC-2 type transport system ATP-binding protein
VLTTHFLDEADRADRIAILNNGKIVALDAPESLRASVGGDSITLHTDEPLELSREIRDEFGLDTSVVDGEIRLELAQGHHWIAKLIDTFPGRIRSVRIGKPTLEDVFTQRTGRHISRSEGSN